MREQFLSAAVVYTPLILMIRTVRSIVVAFLVGWSLLSANVDAVAQAALRQSLSVMTFNIRYGTAKDGEEAERLTSLIAILNPVRWTSASWLSSPQRLNRASATRFSRRQCLAARCIHHAIRQRIIFVNRPCKGQK